MTTTMRREQVRVGDTRTDDRFITMTSHRLLATDVLVVGVIDGTGRLADPSTLLVTTDPKRARRHANTLYERWGGESVEPDYSEHIPGRRRKGYQPGAFTATRVHPPKQTRHGNWNVRWEVAGQMKRRGRRFYSEADARVFMKELTRELGL